LNTCVHAFCDEADWNGHLRDAQGTVSGLIEKLGCQGNVEGSRYIRAESKVDCYVLDFRDYYEKEKHTEHIGPLMVEVEQERSAS
jgi:hypothetical protein